MNAAAERRFERRPGVNETAVDDDVFLVGSDGRQIFHLDAIAGAIWRALETPMSERELAALFAEAFPEIPAGRLAGDIGAALEHLTAGDLIRRQDPPD